jgi:hypothetical protein
VTAETGAKVSVERPYVVAYRSFVVTGRTRSMGPGSVRQEKSSSLPPPAMAN